METEKLTPVEESKKQKCQTNHKKSMKGFGLVVVAVGAMLLTNAIHPNLFHMKFVWPIVIILVGLKWIFSPKSCHPCGHHRGKC